jgi:hypothetical protein
MTLSNDETTVLMIAAQGEYMLAIGRWQLPVTSLASKGLLRSQQVNGGAQYTITEAGHKALGDQEAEEDQKLASVIARSSETIATVRGYAEQAAGFLAKAAKGSHQMTGDSPIDAAKQWSDVVLRRALELLDG